jgi:hypothetical protein
MLFAADACFELARIVAHWPWYGLTPNFAYAVSGLLAVVWAGAGLLQLLRLNRPALGSWALVIGVGAAMLMVFHAALTRVLGSWIGLVNLPLAFTQLLLLHHAFEPAREGS